MPPTVQDGALSIRLPPTYNPKGPPDHERYVAQQYSAWSFWNFNKFYHVTTSSMESKRYLFQVKPWHQLNYIENWMWNCGFIEKSMVIDRAPVNVWQLFWLSIEGVFVSIL